MRSSVVIALFALLMPTQSIAQNVNKFRKYIDNNTRIASIIYPSDWICKEHQGMEMVFLRPQTSVADTVFRENFNLTIGGTMGYSTIEGYMKALPEKLKGYLEHFDQESAEVLTIGKLKCAKTVYNYTMNGFKVKVALYQFMIHDKVYNITCTSTQEGYKLYKGTFDEIGKSFTIR